MIEWWGVLSTVTIGLFAGSLLMEGAVLVPYWRTMPADEFYRLHGAFGPRLFRYFAPLTAGAVILAVTAAALPDATSPLRWAAAGLCLSALVIFFVYFRKANAGFANHALAEEELALELKRWAAWHHARTVLVLAALVLSVLSG